MARTRRKPAFVPKAGEAVAAGVATEFVSTQGNHVEYLSPKKTAHSKAFGPMPPPPAELRPGTSSASKVETQDAMHDNERLQAPPTVDSNHAHREQEETTKKGNPTPSESIKSFVKNWGQKMLDVFYRREFDPRMGQICPECHDWCALYRCSECHHSPAFCAPCVVKAHERHPLHRVDRWSGSHFEPVDLADLGLTVYLGHNGKPCDNIKPSTRASPWTVVHTTGVRKARVMYCNCPDNEKPPVQIWESGWWPASFERAGTVFTYPVLRFYDRLSLQAKTSALDFWSTLRRLTNHVFPAEVDDRYRQLLSAYRQFSFIQACRRHAQPVLAKLPPASLAVLCPACPQLGKNMDPKWKERPFIKRFLDALFTAKDGNFVLSHKCKPLDPNDPSLFDGAMYYGDNAEYDEFMERSKNDEELDAETEICADFKAGKTRYAGKIKSGVITVTCARHGFALPTGTVDVDDGEKYKHVDFATTRAMQWWMWITLLIASYDISCIYDANWLTRLGKMTGISKIWPEIRRCIPKWHAPAHTGWCRWVMSFYYMPGVGQTDGEEPERRWSVLNAIGRIVREMLAGHRQDTINLHYADYNIQKMFGLADTLADKLKTAEEFAPRERKHLDQLEETLSKSGYPLDEWKERERTFQEQVLDRSVPRKSIANPYEPESGNEPTIKMIQEKWSHTEIKVPEASKKRRRGQSAAKEKPPTPTLGALFLQALDIERDQCKVKILLAKEEDENTIEAARDQLESKIEVWFAFRDDVLGEQIAELKKTFPNEAWPERPDECTPEDEVLPLPSMYPPVIRSHVLFATAVSAEREIRRAQASDALRGVRYKLGLKSFLWKKTAGTHGQMRKTRNQTLMSNVDEEVAAYRKEYQHIREQLMLIAEESDTINYLQLTADDCTMLNLYHDQDGPGKNKKELSWIWRQRVYMGEDLNKYASEGVRVEWFRKSARCARWSEQLELVQEEIRRTQRFYRYYERWWRNRSRPTAGSSWTQQGMAAYASRKSVMYAKLLRNAQAKFPEALRV